MTYQDQIKSPKWQRKRLEVMEGRSFECESCGDKEKTLNVHHKIYRKNKKIWEYPNSDLECLCEDCHKESHTLAEKIREALSIMSLGDRYQILGYIEAMADTTPLNAESYEYTVGVGDWLAYAEIRPDITNIRSDKIMGILCDNKGANGIEIKDIYMSLFSDWQGEL